MKIPETVRSFLATHGGPLKLRRAEPNATFGEAIVQAGIEPGQVARGILVKSGGTYLLVVTPADQQLDLETLERLFKLRFEPALDAEASLLFPGCDPAFLPPFGAAYGVKSVQDRRLTELSHVYFPVGVPGLLVRADAAGFAGLQAASLGSYTLTRTQARQGNLPGTLKDVPEMPAIAREIARLRSNPYSHASELSAVLEQDPILSAQLIRYAASPLYGYRGKVESVQQAIVRVLGMDCGYDIALGLALGRPFKNPLGGPLGLDAFWTHAVQCASLTQALCNAVDYSRRPSPGTAYLAGMLHDFGFLLLGYLFPHEFERLNQIAAEQPDRPIQQLEREVVGISHTELGLRLMAAWDMPRDIVEAVREHHDPNYSSDFSDYANLVYIANALLKRNGVGDAESTELPEGLLSRVGLDSARAETAFSTILEDIDGLDFIARKLAA